MSAENNHESNSNNEGTAATFNTTMGTMRSILGVSTALTDTSNDQSGPTSHSGRRLDAQALKFFFDAIDKISGLRGSYDNDVIVVKNSLEDLRTYPNDVERCSAALNNLISVVDHTDVASDFAKLNGFPTVSEFLNSQDNEIVRTAAEVIGVAAQNHARCQEAVLKNKNIFSSLFDILKSSNYQDSVKLKAVFAISSIIQNNKAGLDEFAKLNGYEIFMNLLKVGSIPLKLRTCFVIDCLCSQFPQIKSTLLENDYISCLVDLLTKIPIDESKEYVLSAMLSLVEGCYDAIEECKKEEYNLIATLDYLIAHYKDDTEEEKQKAIKLKGELNRFST